VDDETTKELMIAFYSGMLRENLDPREHYAEAKLKIMRNQPTSAPFFWAAFTITSTAY